MPTCPICNCVFHWKPRYKHTVFCSRPCANTRLRKEHLAESANDWFWSKTKISDSGCIEWVGMIKDNGYGVVYGAFGQKSHMYAHRVSFRLSVGREAVGVVRHKCDNKTCVNPEHLIEGTISDNVRDMVERGQIAKGERSGSAKLTGKDVTEIRSSKEKNTDLAFRYGVSDSTISRLRTGKTWRD